MNDPNEAIMARLEPAREALLKEAESLAPYTHEELMGHTTPSDHIGDMAKEDADL